ncbi:BTB/POZ domain-containing protein 3-like isoform X2 [Paramacrobiotus metropolitanus]|uniref:BTB/POZ domain-containing protein 3-like isoform X2 n=1 Tax=Paramacrobiotus metropolitanus TaxID=2943436 RepID=UPI0024457AF4|nr:BTB/POZ domain-containing protein 3-like isoform X2 [Paramacrobiotus metropolitanus]
MSTNAGGRSRIADLVEQAHASGELSDVCFTVGRQFGRIKDFPAHKFLLGMRSPVFRAMLYGRLAKKGDDTIDIPDIIPDAFANMLSYVYTDTVDDLDNDNVFATMVCADKYDLPELVQKCCSFIGNRLNTTTWMSNLEQAVHWHADSIVEKCLTIVDKDAVAILQSDHFTDISKDILQRILQRNTLMAEEFVIYRAVERWATAACARNAMAASAANRREMLGEALFHVRFSLLTNQELADGPGESGLLTDAELLSLFKYKNATVQPPRPFPSEPRLTREQPERKRRFPPVTVSPYDLTRVTREQPEQKRRYPGVPIAPIERRVNSQDRKENSR